MSIGAFFNNTFPFPAYFFLILGFIGSFGYMVSNFATDKKYEIIAKKKDYTLLEKVNKDMTYDDAKIDFLKEEIWFLVSFEVFNLMFIFTILNLVPYLVIFYALFFSLNAVRKFYKEYNTI